MKKVVVITVGTEAVDLLDVGVNFSHPTVNSHLACTVQELAAQGTLCLITHKEDGGVGPPDVVLEVMLDPTPSTHARGRQDEFFGAELNRARPVRQRFINADTRSRNSGSSQFSG